MLKCFLLFQFNMQRQVYLLSSQKSVRTVAIWCFQHCNANSIQSLFILFIFFAISKLCTFKVGMKLNLFSKCMLLMLL